MSNKRRGVQVAIGLVLGVVLTQCFNAWQSPPRYVASPSATNEVTRLAPSPIGPVSSAPLTITTPHGAPDDALRAPLGGAPTTPVSPSAGSGDTRVEELVAGEIEDERVTPTQPAQSRDRIRRQIIDQSISNYRGSCPCPYNVDRAGRSCGARSAYSRPGGASPVCYPEDVTDTEVDRFLSRSGG